MPLTATKVRVLIVDDHPLVLAGVGEILGGDDSIEIVGVAANAVEALESARAGCPDVIFLNVRLAKNSGFELITQVRQTLPLAECVALSVSDDAGCFRDAMDRGVHGYLLDDASRDEICLAVKRVAAGKSHIDPAVSGYLVQPRRRGTDSVESVPTSREIDVLRLAAQGMTNDAIARRLALKAETIKTHMSRAFERIGAHDRANAVAICMRRGLF